MEGKNGNNFQYTSPPCPLSLKREGIQNSAGEKIY